MFTDTFKLDAASGLFIPHVREHRKLQQVAACAMPGPAYQFMSAPEKEVGLAGNKGGGKTHTLVLRILSGIGRGWGANYNTVLLRASLREMTDLTTLISSIVQPIWGKAVSFNKLNHVYEWRTGERLELNYFLDMSSLDLYYGKQFAVVAWEELGLQKSLEGYLAMFTTLRGPLPESVMPRHVLFTTNPGGPSHNAIKHRFNLSGVPKGAGPCITDANGQTRRIIHCSFEDNVILRRTTPNYMHSIETACEGNEPMLQAFRYGNWDIVAGGALDSIFFQHAKTIFVDDFDIPAGWRTFASYDHGSTRPYAWLAWAESDGTDLVFKNGRTMSTLPGDLFQVGEVYGNRNGEPDKGTGESIAEITMRIQNYKIARGWRYPDTFNPRKWHDMFRRNFADSAIDQDMNEFSVAEEFKHPVRINGVDHPGITFELVTKPQGSRETGFALMRERLINTAPRPDSRIREGKGVFIVRDHCPNTARTLPILSRNPKNLDDVDPASESHIWDAQRYALAADRTPHISSRRRQIF
jgi:hypothetical protein